MKVCFSCIQADTNLKNAFAEDVAVLESRDCHESGRQYWVSCGLCQELRDFLVLWMRSDFNEKFM